MALRQEHGLWATTVRMAELTTLLLEAPLTSTVREVLGEAIEELPGLLYGVPVVLGKFWSDIPDQC